MKKLLLLLMLCVCSCSSNNQNMSNRFFKQRYENVMYSVDKDYGTVDVVYGEYKDGKTTIKKKWHIENNTISFVYLERFDYSIYNYFYEYNSFYRLVIYS